MSVHPDPFTVEFGKVARTIECRHLTGCIIFTFDIKGEHALVLEHHAVRAPRPPNYDEAFARSKQFLESCGYKVEEFGMTRQPDPLTQGAAALVVQGQIQEPPPPSFSLVIPPRHGSFSDDADGSEWKLWVTAELVEGPHAGYKVVFDELTNQFGVASPANVFHGFWGSFRQSVDALLTR
jgi:hypothetical protein